MLQQVLVWRVRKLQFAVERECRDIFTVVENLGEVVLKVADVRLDAVALSYFDSEVVVIILLGLPARGVLGEERLSYLLEIVGQTRRQGIKPIRGHTFQTGRKGQTHERIVTGVDDLLSQKCLICWIRSLALE